ncbi:MAG: transporter substrate-binding domain-containing protein [Alphaproteobacteria bacterium]|nr:transporter substrate-binding domain-containing protein [Alphaproteobacteria bacterium]
MMDKICAAIGIAALSMGIAALVPSSAVAQESTLDAVKQRGTLIAGVKSDYPPFGYVDQGGNVVGFDIEMMKYLAKRLGVKLELKPVSSANRIPMLQSKAVDVVCASMGITKDRVKAVDFTVPYVLGETKFLVKKGSGIKGYADLAGKTITYTQGTPWGDAIKREQPAAKTLVFQDKPQAVIAVQQGRADAYVDDGAPIVVFAKEHKELEAVGEAAPPSPLGIAVRLNDPVWRNEINFALIDAWQDGTYKKLYREYFGEEPNPKFTIYSWTY